MLHLVVMRHTAESCPGRPENQETVVPCVNMLQELIRGRGIKVIGSWADPPGHSNFMIVDLPSAHAMQELLMESGLTAYTTTTVTPVVSLQDV